jgi:hypothetical protein
MLFHFTPASDDDPLFRDIPTISAPPGNASPSRMVMRSPAMPPSQKGRPARPARPPLRTERFSYRCPQVCKCVRMRHSCNRCNAWSRLVVSRADDFGRVVYGSLRRCGFGLISTELLIYVLKGNIFDTIRIVDALQSVGRTNRVIQDGARLCVPPAWILNRF